MTTFKFYLVCSLAAVILKQTYPEWKLFAKEGLELKVTSKTRRLRFLLKLEGYFLEKVQTVFFSVPMIWGLNKLITWFIAQSKMF